MEKLLHLLMFNQISSIPKLNEFNRGEDPQIINTKSECCLYFNSRGFLGKYFHQQQIIKTCVNQTITLKSLNS
ncbi:hypothetical protein M595_0552 [Lyngbya aestuarii BL J]|uniref:Uncharacterized protein n=1 Tax=Lyngbya aestuarii BL J TaxID=1348334 RepID=U7QNI5_9CYAN|nr:hypothetical protein M595_0552 [Lyngbya aestuarii BL J]